MPGALRVPEDGRGQTAGFIPVGYERWGMAGEESHVLPRRVRSLLDGTEMMVAVAESSTGGLVGSKLTNVPGSSAYFDRSLVTYSNHAKIDLLGVDPDTLDTEGAVSAATARQMARGARESAGVNWAVSTTGIAGPGGGSRKKPVGTIFIGTAHKDSAGESVSATRYEFDGSRLELKEAFARQAITDLIRSIESRQ